MSHDKRSPKSAVREAFRSTQSVECGPLLLSGLQSGHVVFEPMGSHDVKREQQNNGGVERKRERHERKGMKDREISFFFFFAPFFFL